MNQNQARLIVGVIIILVVISAGFFFRNDIQTILTGGQQNNQAQTENDTDDLAENGEIVREGNILDVQSLNEEYDLILENKETLLEQLDEWEVYGKEYEFRGAYTAGSPLGAIALFLHNEDLRERGYEPVFTETSFLKMVANHFQIYLYLDPTVLAEPDSGDTVLRNFLGVLYQATHPEASIAEVESEVNNAFNSLKEQNETYFVIQRK